MENTDNQIQINVSKKHLDMELSVKKLDRSHRVGKRNSKNKSRPIVVKFIRYFDCREIFNNKKRLKDTGDYKVSTGRILQLKNARDQFGFSNVWSIDGRIMNHSTGT